jgi:hypothetical protein
VALVVIAAAQVMVVLDSTIVNVALARDELPPVPRSSLARSRARCNARAGLVNLS